MSVGNAFNDFLRGCGYAFRGIKGFWVHPSLWHYAIIPFICVKALCSLLLYVLMQKFIIPFGAWINEILSGWGWEGLAGTVEVIIHWTFIIMMLMVFTAVSNMLFELFGAIFFAKMVRRFEHMIYHRPLVPDISFGEDIWNAITCGIYATITLLFTIVLFIVSFFFPIVAQIVTIVLIGYRYGISYCSESGFNRKLSLWSLQRQFRGAHKLTLIGFGVAVFLLLMIPLISIIFIPGFVIGGTMLVNEECFPPEPFGGVRQLPPGTAPQLPPAYGQQQLGQIPFGEMSRNGTLR